MTETFFSELEVLKPLELCYTLVYRGVILDYTLRFKDCSINYELMPNKTKETLVLLHSYLSSMVIFDQQIITLKKDYQILLFDLPGHGKSDTTRSVGLKDMPEIIKNVLDFHDIKNAHFLGIHEGSIIAQGFAHIYPERFLSLTALSGYSIYHESHKLIQSERLREKIKNSFYYLFSFKKYIQRHADMAAISQPGIDRFVKSSKGFKRKSLLTRVGYNRYFKLGKDIKVYPTYLVCGQHETDVIKDACLLYDQKRPKTVLEGYNDTKRIVFLDQPRLFLEHFLTFLRKQG